MALRRPGPFRKPTTMRHVPIWSLLTLVLTGCAPEPSVSPVDETPYRWDLPAGFPAPEEPADNLTTVARVALGKRLFYDQALSLDSTVSCASCHRQELAFADHQPISAGVQGRLGFRNSPSLANVAYVQAINKDGGVPKLDLQAMVPIEDHQEMSLSIFALVNRLEADARYQDDFRRAYGEGATAFTITRALAAFQRTLISGDATYDQYLRGDLPSLPAAATRGMELFFGEHTQCGGCHGGIFFTNGEFINNGLALEYAADPGRQRVTSLPEDEGKFRVPSLRNVAVTAPYMHDGSLPTLEAVLEHYNQGGRAHPNRDPRIQPLALSAAERSDIIAFLETLTDSTFLQDQRHRP